MSTEPTTRAACERFFRRQGMPLLVEDHSLRRDVFGRSAPFLLAVLVLEGLFLLDGDWELWRNLTALLGALVLAGALWIGLNLLRRRAWHTLPQSIGTPELAFFAVAPGLVGLLLGRGLDSLLLIGVNLLVLLAVYLVVGFGLGATAWWGLARVVDELGSSLRRLVRLLPLTIIFSIVLFFTTEIWQVFDAISGRADLLLGGFFAVLIVALTMVGARREADQILAEAAPDLSPAARSLTPNQRRNLVLMVSGSQVLQIVVVSLATGVFFLLLGMLTITPDLREVWAIAGGSWQVNLQVLGTPMVLDQTLVRVAVALATFNGLYYAINVQVDAVYRTEFVDDLAAQLAHVLRVRERYLDLPGGTY